MHWLVDHARLVYLLLGLVALGFAAAFWLQRRVKLLIPLAATLAVIGLFWLLTQVVVTERMQIERNVRAMAAGIVEGKVEKVMPFVATGFNAQGLDRKAAEAGLKQAVERYKVGDVFIWNFETLEFAEGKSARVGFDCRADGPTFGTVALSFECNFVRENEAWKMRGFESYRLGTREKFPLPLH